MTAQQRWRLVIDRKSEAELRSCANANRTKSGWSFPGQQGLIGNPTLLLVGALTRIARSEPPIGQMFAQGAAERLKHGEDAQEIARGLLSMIE